MRRPARTCTSPWPTATPIAHIAQVDSTYLLGARDWTDIEIPPHSSALGKVLLAWGVLPRPGGRLETPTGHTLRTRGDLDVDLAQVRSRGFAVTRDELEVGLAGVATPVFGPDGPRRRGRRGLRAHGTTHGQGRAGRRLLMDQTEQLSALLGHGTPTEPQAGDSERDTA